MLTVEQVKSSKKVLAEYINQKSVLNDTTKRSISNIEYAHRDQVYELEKAKNLKVNEIESHAKECLENLESKALESKLQLKELSLIFRLMDIDGFDLTGYTVYKYGYVNQDYSAGTQRIYDEPVDAFIVNDCFDTKFYITENSKPKNKYDLIIVGNTIFTTHKYDNPILDGRDLYSYGIDAHTEGANIRYLVKTFETKSLAMDYLVKNKEKLIKSFENKYFWAIDNYKEVVKATDTLEWRKLYLENKRDYFVRGYSNYEQEQGYIEVMEELNSIA